MRKILFIFFGIISTLPALAQDTTATRKIYRHNHTSTLNKNGEEGVINYHKQTVFGIKLTNDGYGITMEMGRQQSIKKSLLFQLEITERKSAKEEKQTNPETVGSAFIYGKENFFYPIKLGVQQQILLGNKSNKNGVSVSTNFGGGIVLALLRPYEMNVITDSAGDTKFIRYNSQDSALFLTQGSLGGYDPYTGNIDPIQPGFLSGPTLGRGWNNLSVVPGLYAKSGLRFDYGRANETVSAVEVGLSAEYYGKKIPIIVNVPEKQFFLNAYITLMFGKRK
jgi:hypothetical protein